MPGFLHKIPSYVIEVYTLLWWHLEACLIYFLTHLQRFLDQTDKV